LGFYLQLFILPCFNEFYLKNLIKKEKKEKKKRKKKIKKKKEEGVRFYLPLEFTRCPF